MVSIWASTGRWDTLASIFRTPTQNRTAPTVHPRPAEAASERARRWADELSAEAFLLASREANSRCRLA